MDSSIVKLRAVLADDHPIVLSGLRALLGLRPQTEVVGFATDGASALRMIRDAEPELVLLDINMPALSGVDVLESIERNYLATRVILLTASASDSHIERAILAGAWGIMLKDTAADKLLECIEQIVAGERWLPSNLVDSAMAREAQKRGDGKILEDSLTVRENQIMELVAEGLSNKQIARRIGISEGTVKIRLHNVHQKLGISNRTALATRAYRSRKELSR